ncbi:MULTISPECIES: PAAR-like domain-containing protein [Mesorhizobium]|uniref:PAAR-like domain-containing protein n=1 Tax=Mesorhizobium TaxID=68287 RepID=UPI0003CFC2F7|nr:PAAR-like domain-containing protein [Mesorhizobium sp. LNHC209A00]ESY89948.1 hypothetical protein X738_31115 [Mesorhizobium sp. LNHC209A00]
MGLTVYAEGMGFFHKGSDGKGIAPGDVCLSPPPPPTGPVPVPYVNMLSSSDLSKGSKSVKFDGGNPTALEDASEISTSTGNEAGTQGGGVITHKTKGKGVFQLWSFVVKVEGKGVGRHGDMMGQNEASNPLNCIDTAAFNKFLKKLTAAEKSVKCDPPYSEACRPSRKAEQRDAVNGKPCWQCRPKATQWAPGKAKRQKTFNPDGTSEMKNYMTHDHQPPLAVAWEMGGCNMQPSPGAFKEHFSTAESVKPHCRSCYQAQGSPAAKYAKNFIDTVPGPI